MPRPETPSVRYVPVAIERAPAKLGLHQIDDTTFVVGKTRIHITETGLQITLFGANPGQETQFSSSLYELNTADGTFLLTLENGRLVINQEVSVTSTWHIHDEPQNG